MKKNLKKGFSLIEISLLLIVFGALAVVALQNYQAETDTTKIKVVYEKMRDIKNAIDTYVITNGYYPCPANPYLDSSSEYYAKGPRDINGNCQMETACNTATPGGSSPDDVLCYADPSFDRTAISANYSVPEGDFLMGAVPCEDLGLNRDCMLTSEGLKIGYSTSSHLSRVVPCASYISSTGALEVPASYKFKVMSNFNKDDSVATNYGNYPTFASATDRPDYILWYSGADSIGAWTREGTRITGTSVSSGGFINDNLFQQVNHNINTSSQTDDYFLIPQRPLDTPDSDLVSANSKVVFGDILMYGKVSDTVLPKMVCLDCQSCDGAWQNRVVRLTSFTNCSSTTPVAHNGVNGLCD